MEIIDHTETNLIALRRTIYLTIQSRLFSLYFSHPLLFIHLFIHSPTQTFSHFHSFFVILSFPFLHFHSFVFIFFIFIRSFSLFLFLPLSFFLFSSLDFEECAHKLLKMQLKDEQLVNYPLFAFCRLSHRITFHSRP